MGFAIGDIARTNEEFQQCASLVKDFAPGLQLPAFGQPANSTLIIRDGDQRDRIVGMIHLETATEVRAFLIDPTYKYQDASSTILFNCAETAMRVQGIRHYYFNVPREHEAVVKLYKKMGAQEIDAGVVRFLKAL